MKYICVYTDNSEPMRHGMIYNIIPMSDLSPEDPYFDEWPHVSWHDWSGWYTIMGSVTRNFENIDEVLKFFEPLPDDYTRKDLFVVALRRGVIIKNG